MLHVPVKEFTADTATVKQRIQEGRKICAIQFTNGDVFGLRNESIRKTKTDRQETSSSEGARKSFTDV